MQYSVNSLLQMLYFIYNIQRNTFDKSDIVETGHFKSICTTSQCVCWCLNLEVRLIPAVMQTSSKPFSNQDSVFMSNTEPMAPTTTALNTNSRQTWNTHSHTLTVWIMKSFQLRWKIRVTAEECGSENERNVIFLFNKSLQMENSPGPNTHYVRNWLLLFLKA